MDSAKVLVDMVWITVCWLLKSMAYTSISRKPFFFFSLKCTRPNRLPSSCWYASVFIFSIKLNFACAA